TSDGRVVVAGAHEDLLVFRRARGRFERVAAPGTWLGARPDVSKATVDTGLRLDDGDILVLYTDGITEAMSADGEAFGLDRLCAAVAEVAGEATTKILEHLMAEVEGFMARQEDDMTALVLRYRGVRGIGETPG